MNLLSGHADGARFQVGTQSLALPQAAPRTGELILGLRPEHGGLNAAGGAGWSMQVDTVEMLGAERLVHGQVGGAAFTLRIDSTLVPPNAGDSVTLQPALEHLHWFDPQTKTRIE
jgi:sn-glycerol 3-phosphate transport system ATP-binding protein